MSDEKAVIVKFPEQEPDEVADVLAALKQLAGQVTSPVVRACLEEAAEDIAHLTDCGDRQEEVEREAV